MINVENLNQTSDDIVVYKKYESIPPKTRMTLQFDGVKQIDFFSRQVPKRPNLHLDDIYTFRV